MILISSNYWCWLISQVILCQITENMRQIPLLHLVMAQFCVNQYDSSSLLISLVMSYMHISSSYTTPLSNRSPLVFTLSVHNNSRTIEHLLLLVDLNVCIFCKFYFLQKLSFFLLDWHQQLHQNVPLDFVFVIFFWLEK